MKKEKVYGYSRVSSYGQIEGDGFPRQEQAIQEYCQVHNMNLIKIWQEKGVSGVKEERETLSKMLYSLEKNGLGVKKVLVENLSRLSRDLITQEILIRNFERKGIQIVSVSEGQMDNDNPSKVFIRQVLGSVYQLDKSLLVDKLRVARQRKKVESGKCEGRKRYDESDEGIVIIKLAKQLRRKERGVDIRKPFAQIARTLNEKGYRTLDGKMFTAGIVHNIIKKY